MSNKTTAILTFVAPVRERGLKSADHSLHRDHLQVAPVRERGLKFPRWSGSGRMVISRSREGAWIEIWVPIAL